MADGAARAVVAAGEARSQSIDMISKVGENFRFFPSKLPLKVS